MHVNTDFKHKFLASFESTGLDKLSLNDVNFADLKKDLHKLHEQESALQQFD